MELSQFTVIALLSSLCLVNGQRQPTPGWSSPGSSSDGEDHDHGQWPGVGSGQSGWGSPSTEDYRESSQSQHQRFGSSNFAKPHARHIERYGYPDQCVHERDPGQVCNYYVEITNNPNNSSELCFELFAHLDKPNEGGYVAMGLSLDKQMGNDDILECVKEGGGSIRQYHSWAEAKSQPTRLPEDRKVVSMIASEFNGNTKLLTCRFIRPMVADFLVKGRPTNINFITGKYYVLLAVGGLKAHNSDGIGYHGDAPLTIGKAYVSPDFLGYSQAKYQAQSGSGGEHGYRPPEYENSGQQNKMGTCAVVGGVVLFSFLRLIY